MDGALPAKINKFIQRRWRPAGIAQMTVDDAAPAPELFLTPSTVMLPWAPTTKRRWRLAKNSVLPAPFEGKHCFVTQSQGRGGRVAKKEDCMQLY